jgi:tRNA threonylcarbamoyl adenosine modification protein YeaZ
MSGVWLAIDTATEVASVVVADGREGSRQIGASGIIRGARQQASRIVAVIDETLRQAGTTLNDVAGIVVGDGPGSFTGLRVGWAAAKGLVHEREIPLFAVPSLMGLAWVAWNEFGLGPTATIAACFDALRGQVYGALYRVSRDRVETLVTPAVLTIAEFQHLAPIPPDAAIGDGARRFSKEIHGWTGRPPLDAQDESGAHATVAHGLLAVMRYEGAVHGIPVPATAEPVYGRPAEAQARWEARHGRALRDSPRASD